MDKLIDSFGDYRQLHTIEAGSIFSPHVSDRTGYTMGIEADFEPIDGELLEDHEELPAQNDATGGD
jgi:hypothetical protein